MRRIILILAALLPTAAFGQSRLLSILLGSPPARLSTDSLVLQLEADNLGSQWQTISGTTAVAADGDVVGTWNDLSTNGFNFTATADDTTRLTHKIVNGVHSNSCDGVDDKLRRTASLGLYAAGSATVMIAFTHDTSDNGTLLGIGKAGTSLPAYQLANISGTDTNDLGAFIRNDSSVSILNNVTIADEAIFNSTNYILTVVDDGTSVSYYIDGVLLASATYTRSGVISLDQTAICSDAKNTFGGLPKVYIQGVWAWTRTLTPSEVKINFRYAKVKQGR